MPSHIHVLYTTFIGNTGTPPPIYPHIVYVSCHDMAHYNTDVHSPWMKLYSLYFPAKSQLQKLFNLISLIY